MQTTITFDNSKFWIHNLSDNDIIYFDTEKEFAVTYNSYMKQGLQFTFNIPN